MAKQTIYTVGGTVQAGGGIYIKRKADDELLELCRQGELAFILSSRQVGKSSLMTQTAEQLKAENIRSATVDLSSIGTKVTQDEWYLGILNVIATDLDLQTELFTWWNQYSGLGSAQRFFNFLRDVMLKEISDCIVLFFDEIDTTLSIPFADDFFAALRATYNARSTAPDFKRLSFVLVGVATPSDLISDEKRTPFNIGRRVELNDFTLEEAMPLAQGLGAHAEQVLAWILEWTGGHPYLTQRLCDYVSKGSAEIDRQAVDKAAEDLFLGEQGKQDNNLQFVRDMLVKRSADTRSVMTTYGAVRSGKKVPDDERSIVKSHLKISGVVKRQSENLVTRNQIYERTFDPKWIKENTPSAVPRRIMLGSLLVVTFALLIAGYFAYENLTRTDEERAARFISNFQAAKDSAIRLENLAGLFGLPEPKYSDQARALFRDSTQDEKLQLFAPASSKSVQKNQVIVVSGLYQHLNNTEDENELLQTLALAVQDSAPSLFSEISFWLEGRESLNRALRENNKELREQYFLNAKRQLSIVSQENPKNPAVYYDLAQVHLSLKDYPATLVDLNEILRLDSTRLAEAESLLQSDSEFATYWIAHRQEEPYTDLANAISPGFTPVYFSQIDPQWKDEILGFGGPDETIGLYGPAVTSVAMLLRGYGFPETPLTLNEKLKSVNGYVSIGLRWGAVSQIYPNVTLKANIQLDTEKDPRAQIDQSLAEGKPVIVMVDASSAEGIQTHYVLVYARKDEDYLMLDPWPDQRNPTNETLLKERYGQDGSLENAIFQAIIYEVTQ